MSAFINSMLIEPVVRQARRFSYPAADGNPPDPLSHAADSGSAGQLNNQDVQQRPQNQLQSNVEAQANLNRSSSSSFGHPLRDSQYGADLEDVRRDHVFDQPRLAPPDGINESDQSGSVQALPSTHRRLQGTLDSSLRSSSLDQGSDMTRNPSFGIPQRLRGQNVRLSTQSRRSISSADLPSGDQDLIRSREDSGTGVNMSGGLPYDDGMKPLREKIHLIRNMALSSEEKARRMHALMIADYEAFKASADRTGDTSKRHSETLTSGANHVRIASIDGDSYRSPTPIPTVSAEDTKNELIVSPDDLEPTYQPRSAKIPTQSSANAESVTVREVEEQEDELSLGCKHYLRNVKIQCDDCKRWYTCRHCHDDSESHPLNRKTIKNMLCMLCGHPQKADEYCAKCGNPAAAYYCRVCQLWEDDPGKRIYHCVDCGICRRGEGIGKDFIHCKKCNVCIAIAWIGSHRCVERATECDCPICNDWMFTSSAAVVAMRCGHYIHRKCYDEYMHTSYKCPICNRSAVNMELQWRKLDRAIEAQPMPSQFSDTKAWINCNDCAARTCTKYHWLGNKCTVCDSYNTNYVKLINSPMDHELEAISSNRAAQALRAAEQTIANSDDNPQARTSSLEGSTNLRETEADGLQTPRNGVTARSAESLSIPHEMLASTPALDPLNERLPQLPINGNFGESSIEMIAREGEDDDEEDEEEDDVGFWGEGISPSTWSMPMGISPMSGWTSPGFFATRMEARNGEANRDEVEGEVDDVDDDAEWSTDDSDEEELVELDEDGDVEEIELFGHR